MSLSQELQKIATPTVEFPEVLPLTSVLFLSSTLSLLPKPFFPVPAAILSDTTLITVYFLCQLPVRPSVELVLVSIPFPTPLQLCPMSDKPALNSILHSPPLAMALALFLANLYFSIQFFTIWSYNYALQFQLL